MTIEQIRQVSACERPVQLSGLARHVDSDGVITKSDHVAAYASCKTRRASQCEPCSTLYRHDARHLIAAGLRGGKGVDEEVAKTPAHFVTFTAPSFGLVHSVNGHKCFPRRKAETCEHGVLLVCWQVHTKGDAAVGQPFCVDCYDYESAVMWNNAAPALWRTTRINIDRMLCSMLGLRVTTKATDRPFTTQYVKVAEFQARGLVHFHVAIRVDGLSDDENKTRRAAQRALATAEPDQPGYLAHDLYEKQQFVASLLASAITQAARQAHVTAVNGQGVQWGEQLDIKSITANDDSDEQDQPDVSRQKVSNYLSKYATKGSDTDDKLAKRFRNENELQFLQVNTHLARMVRTSWNLNNKHADARLDAWSHQFGYRGHFLTKSRGWSTTFKALRQVRKDHQERKRKASWQALNPDVVQHIVTKWTFDGSGYRNGFDDAVAEALRNKPRSNRAA